MKVRVKFRKYGPVRFIGHLDVMRFFQKLLRRAQIDVAYTGGFNPHQIMSFASPLGVGLESNGEYMDIECHTVTSQADMIARMNAASVAGIEVISVKFLPDDAEHAMASVAAARYTVFLRKLPDLCKLPDSDPEKQTLWELFSSRLPDFLAQEEIRIVKEGKKGPREVDIRPGIYEFEIDPAQEKILLLLDASSAGNIKPVQVVSAFFSFCGLTLAENALRIIREETYTNTGTAEEPVFLSLDEVGQPAGEDTGTPV